MFKFIVSWIAIVLMNIWRGYVLSVLWAWFIVNAFHVPTLSIVNALGLSLTVGMFISSESSSKKGEDFNWEFITFQLIKGFLTPLLFLGIGWIYLLFR